MKPTVSLCIPAYRQAEGLQRTLASITDQSYTDYEVIVTDDSPDDAVMHVVRDHANRLPLRYYKNKDRKGSPANWNEAMSKARGDYIKIMHHDDWLAAEDSLSCFVALLERNPSAILAFSGANVCAMDGTLKRVHTAAKLQIRELRRDPNYLFTRNFIGAPSATILRNVGTMRFDTHIKWLVDMEFYMRVLRSSPSFEYTATPLVCTTHGAPGQVTLECLNNREVEVFEWCYLYQQLPENVAHLSTYERVIAAVFEKYGVQGEEDLLSLGLSHDSAKSIWQTVGRHRSRQQLRRLMIMASKWMKSFIDKARA